MAKKSKKITATCSLNDLVADATYEIYHAPDDKMEQTVKRWLRKAIFWYTGDKI